MNPFYLDILCWLEIPVIPGVVVDTLTDVVTAALDDSVPADVTERVVDFSIEKVVEGYLQALQVTIPNKSGCGVAK